MALFSFLVVVVFHFALPGGATAEARAAARRDCSGSRTSSRRCSGSNRAFALELENDALSGLALAPADRGFVFLGKAAANFVMLGVVQVADGRASSGSPSTLDSAPVRAAARRRRRARLARASARVGTLFAAVAVRTRYREVMLPLLLLPLLVPVLLGRRARDGGAAARPARSPFESVQLLVVTDAVFLIVSFRRLRVRTRRIESPMTAMPLRDRPRRESLRAPRRRSRPRSRAWASQLVARAPIDSMQGVIQKILYVHVPLRLRGLRGLRADRASAARSICGAATSATTASPAPRAEVGVLFCTLVHRDRPDLGARAPGDAGGPGTRGSPSRCCSGSSTSPTCCCAASPRAASATARFAAVYGIAGLAAIPLNYFAIDLVGRPRDAPREPRSAGSLGAGMGWPVRARRVVCARWRSLHLLAAAHRARNAASALASARRPLGERARELRRRRLRDRDRRGRALPRRTSSASADGCAASCERELTGRRHHVAM